MKNIGNHVLIDFINCVGHEELLGDFIFKLMIESIENTNMKIVHRKLQILNKDTPAGFTAVLLLDESHFTAHAYTDLGLLAIDIFTCGETEINDVVNYFYLKLKKFVPDIEIKFRETVPRFII